MDITFTLAVPGDFGADVAIPCEGMLFGNDLHIARAITAPRNGVAVIELAADRAIENGGTQTHLVTLPTTAVLAPASQALFDRMVAHYIGA
jgi:hypothetical protein